MSYRPWLMHTARAIYAMNWYDISPGLVYIQGSLNVSEIHIGILVTAFYIGVGVFQLPGGYLATKFGNRNIASLGLLGLGVAAIASALSGNFITLTTSRFFAGVFSGMFFSPEVGLLRSATSESEYPFHVNFFNGSFNLGAAVGIGVWGYFDATIGWNYGFLIAGFLTIGIALFHFVFLKSVKEEKGSLSPSRNYISVLKNRLVWIIAFAGTASVIAENVAGTLIVYYMEHTLGIANGLSAFSGTIFLAAGFVGGIIGGILIGNFKNVKAFFLLMTALTSVLMMLIAVFTSVLAIYALMALLGIVTVQGFSAIYVIISRNMPERSQTTSSLSVVNAAQEIPGSVWPFVFTLIGTSISFRSAWVIIGLISLAFMALVFLPGSKRRARER